MSWSLNILQQLSLMFRGLLPSATALLFSMQAYHKWSCTGNKHQSLLSVLYAFNDP